MPGPIKKLADKFLTDPKTIEVARPATANASIDQRVLKVDSRRKKQVLTDRLKGHDVRSALVFCNRKTTVRELAQSLKRSGLNAGEIHGDMEQPERIRELDRFKDGEINILVASDVAARGLDIKDVSHVFNYDVPWHPDDYIHRIGRTGRAGKTGIAITLATARRRRGDRGDRETDRGADPAGRGSGLPRRDEDRGRGRRTDGGSRASGPARAASPGRTRNAPAGRAAGRPAEARAPSNASAGAGDGKRGGRLERPRPQLPRQGLRRLKNTHRLAFERSPKARPDRDEAGGSDA